MVGGGFSVEGMRCEVGLLRSRYARMSSSLSPLSG